MLKNETPRGEMEAAEDAYEEQSSGVGSYEEYGDSEAFGENGFDGYEEEEDTEERARTVPLSKKR